MSRYELVSKVHAPVQAANTDVLPEAVETPPLNLQRRVKNAKKQIVINMELFDSIGNYRGDCLKLARQAKGVTGEELATALG